MGFGSSRSSKMWKARGRTVSTDTVGSFAPTEVLFDYDGPRTFVCISPQGALLFAHQCGEDRDCVRFAVVGITQELLEYVKAGDTDVWSVLKRSPLLLVDVGADWVVLAVLEASFDWIPARYLPKPGVKLWPAESGDPDAGRGNEARSADPPRPSHRATQPALPFVIDNQEHRLEAVLNALLGRTAGKPGGFVVVDLLQERVDDLGEDFLPS